MNQRRRQQEKTKELKKTLKVLKQRVKDKNKVAKLKEKGLKKLVTQHTYLFIFTRIVSNFNRIYSKLHRDTQYNSV